MITQGPERFVGPDSSGGQASLLGKEESNGREMTLWCISTDRATRTEHKQDDGIVGQTHKGKNRS